MTELDCITLCESLTTDPETMDAMIEAIKDQETPRKGYSSWEEAEKAILADEEDPESERD